MNSHVTIAEGIIAMGNQIAGHVFKPNTVLMNRRDYGKMMKRRKNGNIVNRMKRPFKESRAVWLNG